MEKEILEYLKSKNPKLSAIATANEKGEPECAILGYAVMDDLTIILSTHKGSRKWKNLESNPQLAIAIGWSFTEMFIQYAGKARLVTEGEEYAQTETFFFEQNPNAKKFKSPETGFIKITPRWIKLSDYTKQPPRIEEKQF